MEIPYPKFGRSDLLADAKQPPFTTARSKNTRLHDRGTGRLCGAQRAGLTKVAPDPLNGSEKVSHLAEVVQENAQQTFTALGNASTVDASTSTPNAADLYAMAKDAQGNIYVADGATGVTKYNPDFVKQWKIALPAADPNAVIRTIAVDDALRVFVAVSSGGDVAKAAIWAYEQLEDNKTELLWTETPGWFTETLWLEGLTLYAGQNNPLLFQSRVAMYTGIGVDSPVLSKAFTVPYPINFLSTSPKDQSLFISHAPLANRGFFPRSPETTTTSEDWQITSLSHYSERAHCWLSSMDVLGTGTDSNDDVDDTLPMAFVGDRTGNGRVAVALGTGPTLLRNAVAGHDVLHFDGSTQALRGAAGTSTDFLFRSLNKGLLPCHAKHQYVMFLVVRAPQSATRSSLFSQAFTTATNIKDRRIYLNAGITGGGSSSPTNESGQVQVYDETTAGSGASGVSGSHGPVPLPGGFDASGLILISLGFDHGYDDVTGTPTRSFLRVNGRPIDRWHSDTGFESLTPAALGIELFSNLTTGGNRATFDLLEYFVLSDWYDATGVQQRLIEMPTYPDSNWAANSATELEKLEGFFAHRCGMAHLLPSGHQATLEATGTIANNDTVTIGGTVYTFKTTLTPAANEVLRQTGGVDALRNLHHAINGTGAKGTAYGAATVPDASLFSPGVISNDGTSTRPMLIVQRRDARGASFVIDESTSEARVAWLPVVGGTGTNASVRSRAGSGIATGIYPHPYYLFATLDSVGGPPSSTGSAASIASALSSPYGLLTKWDPINGKLRNALTTGGPASGFGLPFGGIGYGHIVASDGSIFTTGPRQAAVLTFSADNTDRRKIVDSDTLGFVVTDAAGATGAWTAATNAQTYEYPRLAVDKWDNVYFPIFEGSNGTSALVYKKDAPSSSQNSALLYSLTTLTDDPKAHAILVDSAYPDLPSSFTNPRAERFYLATRKESTNTTVLYAIRQLSVAATGASPRTIIRVAISGGNLYKVNVGSAATLVQSSFVDSSARFVDSATLKGVLYAVDGVRGLLYDARKSLVGPWRAARGKIPVRAMLIERYVKRLYLGAFGDDRFGWACSQYGDAYGWDFDPPGDSPLAIAAIHSDTSLLGGFGDTLTCLCANKDDYMIVGGDHTISMLRGDPAQGGKFDDLVHGIGIAFGRARCFTPDGRFWFITNQGEMYSLVIGNRPEKLSNHIQKMLANGLDFSVARPELRYDPAGRSIKIIQIPHGSGSTALQHWELELDTMAFGPDTYGLVGITPTASMLVDGDAPNDRQFWLGNADGRIRYIDAAKGSDDGTRIDSEVLLHMPYDPDQPIEARFEHLQVILDQDAGAAEYEFLAGDRPDNFGTAKCSGALLPGRNRPGAVRVTAPWGGLLLKGKTTAPYAHWALQRVTIDATQVGASVD